MPYEPYIEMHVVESGDVFDTSEHHITTLPAVHSAVNGKMYLIERDGKSLLYLHDTGFPPEEALELIRKHATRPVDLVSMDCTFGPNPLPPGYSSHM